MEIKSGTRVELIAMDFERQKEKRAERASSFPESTAEYMSLSGEERMLMAGKLTSEYANITHTQNRNASIPPLNAVEVTVGTDVDYMQLVAWVGYDQGDHMNALNDTFVDRHPGIKVWFSIQDTLNHVQSPSSHLGEINLGSYYDDVGDLHPINSPHAILPSGKISDLSSNDGANLVEIVDAAVGELIETKVNRDRSLAIVAMNSAT